VDTCAHVTERILYGGITIIIIKTMNDWLKNNLWSIIIAVVTMISTFSLYGYRITALEKQTEQNAAAIAVISTQQNVINVQLAQISTDIQYIKVNIDRLFGRSPSTN
jgi:hypothetical protein